MTVAPDAVLHEKGAAPGKGQPSRDICGTGDFKGGEIVKRHFLLNATLAAGNSGPPRASHQKSTGGTHEMERPKEERDKTGVRAGHFIVVTCVRLTVLSPWGSHLFRRDALQLFLQSEKNRLERPCQCVI